MPVMPAEPAQLLDVFEVRLDVQLLARSLRDAERLRDRLMASAATSPTRTEVTTVTASAGYEGETPDEVVGRHSKAVPPPFLGEEE